MTWTEVHQRFTLDRLYELTGEVKQHGQRIATLETKLPLSSGPSTGHGLASQLTHALHVGHLATEVARMVVRAILWLIPRLVTYGGALFGVWSALRGHP